MISKFTHKLTDQELKELNFWSTAFNTNFGYEPIIYKGKHGEQWFIYKSEQDELEWNSCYCAHSVQGICGWLAGAIACNNGIARKKDQ